MESLTKADRPIASVIILCYNHAPFIKDALMSVFSQDIEGFEVVIVDDASTDGTADIVDVVLGSEITRGYVIRKIFKKRNEGLLAAVNDAMACASGSIITIMAGDDISMPDRLSKSLKVFSSNPTIQLVYGDYIKIDEAGLILSRSRRTDSNRVFSYDKSLKGIYANASPFGAAASYRRELFDFFGPMASGTHGEDNCYWVRALLMGIIYYDSSVYVKWRKHGNNLSNFSFNLDSKESRHRHLTWMSMHCTMSPQWIKDILLAEKHRLIKPWRAWRLRWLAKREDSKWSLEISSMVMESHNKWLRKWVNLLFLGRISYSLKMIKVRYSQRHRNRHWKKWAKVMG
jgi:glycosyltransferase involved in cell wall biosynthesis